MYLHDPDVRTLLPNQGSAQASYRPTRHRSLHISVAEANSREMASESQFLGVQFAAVMLVWLLVGVERDATDAAVDVCTARDHFDVTTDVIIILPTYKLVFSCRTLHTRYRYNLQVPTTTLYH